MKSELIADIIKHITRLYNNIKLEDNIVDYNASWDDQAKQIEKDFIEGNGSKHVKAIESRLNKIGYQGKSEDMNKLYESQVKAYKLSESEGEKAELRTVMTVNPYILNICFLSTLVQAEVLEYEMKLLEYRGALKTMDKYEDIYPSLEETIQRKDLVRYMNIYGNTVVSYNLVERFGKEAIENAMSKAAKKKVKVDILTEGFRPNTIGQYYIRNKSKSQGKLKKERIPDELKIDQQMTVSIVTPIFPTVVLSYEEPKEI